MPSTAASFYVEGLGEVCVVEDNPYPIDIRTPHVGDAQDIVLLRGGNSSDEYGDTYSVIALGVDEAKNLVDALSLAVAACS